MSITLEELSTLSENELYMQKYCSKHNHPFPLDLFSELPIDKWSKFHGFTLFSPASAAVKIPLSYDKNTHLDQLTESFFHDQHTDVIVTKHANYSPPITHTHTFFEILYVLKGSCTNIIDSIVLDMKEGDICIIPPKVKHAIYAVDGSCVVNVLVRKSTFEKYFVGLLENNDLLSTFFNSILHSNRYRKYILFHADSSSGLSDIILAMIDQQTFTGLYQRNISNGMFLLFCGFLLRDFEETVDYPASYYEELNITPQILSYIEQHFDDVSLTSLEREFHLTSNYISKLIKKETNSTFNIILTDIRIRKASDLLSNTDISVSKIAELSGYNDPAYFMRSFKKKYGCTPSEYRNSKS